MEVFHRLSEFAHTQMEKFGPGLFWCITIFFKLFDVCLFQCTGSLLLLFSTTVSYFSRQTVLTHWAQPSLHSAVSNHLLFFIVTNSVFVCFQMYVKSTFVLVFFLFFFNFMIFLVHRHMLTQ